QSSVKNPWQLFFEQLQSSHRATRARVSGFRSPGVPGAPGSGVPGWSSDHQITGSPDPASWFWVSAEKAKALRAIYPEAQFEHQLPEVEGEAPSRDDALKAAITGWLTHLGPTTGSALAKLLCLPSSDIDKVLLRI